MRKLTAEQVAAIESRFHRELCKPYMACDLYGSLADLVEDALAIALRDVGAEGEDEE